MQNSNELMHYGVLGMKWGVRRGERSNNPQKRHLGIDKKGRINLVSEKTTKRNVAVFATKTALFAGGMSVAVYLSKHPRTVEKGMNAVSKALTKMGIKKVTQVASKASDGYGVYSKKLGRMLTMEELLEKGLV